MKATGSASRICLRILSAFDSLDDYDAPLYLLDIALRGAKDFNNTIRENFQKWW